MRAHKNFFIFFFFNPCLLSSLPPPSFWLPPVGAARFLLLLPYPASGCTNAYILVTSCISRHEFFFYSGIPIVRGMEGSLIVTIMSTNGTPATAALKRSGPQLLKCQYLYFCTRKASNASTWTHVEDRAHQEPPRTPSRNRKHAAFRQALRAQHASHLVVLAARCVMPSCETCVINPKP